MEILYPPRPKSKIPPGHLSKYEGSYFVQPKYNGTRNLIHIYPNNDIVMINRHGELHKQYSLPEYIIEQILSLNLEEGKEYWIDSELMHNKTTNLKNTIVLFDVLQAGKYLFRIKQAERLILLNKICGEPNQYEEKGRALKVSENIWMAPVFDQNFRQYFDYFSKFEEVEGLVLRAKNSCLDNFGRKEYEVPWMIRCRKPSKFAHF